MYCHVIVRIMEPDLQPAPTFFPELGESAYRFGSEHKTWYNSVQFKRAVTSSAPEDVLLQNLSKNLPQHVFLYIAPKTVRRSDSEKNGFPYLLEQGRMELFVYPKD
ncbi:MAG: hypothetical protein GX093_00940 [Xanthomonadaceae bacterium]|nr:hypothetical protein [Xanthomonadaceae bacterium]